MNGFFRFLARLVGRRGGGSPAAQTWTMTIPVTPADADVQFTFDGKTWPAGPGGESPRVIEFTPSTATPNVAGLLTVTRPGFKPQGITIPNIGPPSVTIVPVALDVDRPTLAPIAIAGAFFRSGTARFTAIQCSDFMLFRRWLDGGPDAIRAILEDRSVIGFNMIRVFGMCWNLFQLAPAAEGLRFFEELPRFITFVASFGIYTEFVVFPDCKLVMPQIDDQLVHWLRIGDALRPVARWVIVEHQNEADQPPNVIDSGRFNRLNGVICSHGSTGSQGMPVSPPWDYETFHVNDAYEWWRKDSHNGMELTEGTEGIVASHVPVLANEKTRPDRDPILIHHNDAARACRLLIAGSCFHSISGRTSEIFSDSDRPFAEAFVDGASDPDVDLRFQDGDYRHDPHWEKPTELRVYRRYLGEEFAEVRIDK